MIMGLIPRRNTRVLWAFDRRGAFLIAQIIDDAVNIVARFVFRTAAHSPSRNSHRTLS